MAAAHTVLRMISAIFYSLSLDFCDSKNLLNMIQYLKLTIVFPGFTLRARPTVKIRSIYQCHRHFTLIQNISAKLLQNRERFSGRQKTARRAPGRVNAALRRRRHQQNGEARPAAGLDAGGMAFYSWPQTCFRCFGGDPCTISNG
jgi:hypothetical protein